MEEEHLSYSQLNQWLGCQKQFYYQRMERLQPQDLSSNLIVGSAYHSAAEMYHKAKLSGEKPVTHSEMVDVFEQILLEEEAENLINWGKSSREAEVKKADGVFNAFLTGQVENEVVAVEQMIRIDIEGLPPVIGRVDLIERTSTNEIVIVDLKTSATKPSLSSDPYVLNDIDGSHQMTLYQMWAEKEFQQTPIKLRMDYLVKSTRSPSYLRLETKRTEADIAGLKTLLISVWGQIQMTKAGVIDPLPMRSFRCNGCGYRAICNTRSAQAA